MFDDQKSIKMMQDLKNQFKEMQDPCLKGNFPNQKSMAMLRKNLVDLGFSSDIANRLTLNVDYKISTDLIDSEEFQELIEEFAKLIQCTFKWFNESGFGVIEDFLEWGKHNRMSLEFTV